MAWGLVVDREFGSCRCADEDEMEFSPDAANYMDNMWACRCLNTDLYLSQPEAKYECVVDLSGARDASLSTTDGSCNAGMMKKVNDMNGKKCGISDGCKNAAVFQQRERWNQEAARALSTKESARTYAKKSMMPDSEVQRARTLRLKMTKENRMRARVQVASISMKYRAVKNSMLSGAIDKAAFEKAYKLVASTIRKYREEFASRQKGIEESWALVVQRQRAAEKYLVQDMNKIESIYE